MDLFNQLGAKVSFTGQRGFEKVYGNGMVISADSVYTRDEIEAYFPGGSSVWTRYIMSQVERNLNEPGTNDYGTCIIKFIVDIDGKVTGAEATTMLGTKLAEIAVGAISNGPKWNPAMHYGRPVRAYRLQPVSISKRN